MKCKPRTKFYTSGLQVSSDFTVKLDDFMKKVVYLCLDKEYLLRGYLDDCTLKDTHISQSSEGNNLIICVS